MAVSIKCDPQLIKVYFFAAGEQLTRILLRGRRGLKMMENFVSSFTCGFLVA